MSATTLLDVSIRRFGMWLLYSAYLHTRLYVHRRGMWLLSAGLGVLCYLSLVFTYIMAWYFPGEHTF